MEKEQKSGGVHAGHRARMRERFLKVGGNGFADHELLELLLFQAIPRKDTNSLAHRLIEEFGSLSGVLEADIDLLCRVEGVSLQVAVSLKTVGEVACRYAAEKFDPEKKKTVFDSPEKIVTFLASRYLSVPVERVYLLLFDNGMHMIDCYHVCDGSIVGAGTSVRRMAERAYKKGAANAILAHNHPGGMPFPSQDDIRVTRRLHQALEILEISLLEHYIFADHAYAPILNRCVGIHDEGLSYSGEAAVASSANEWIKKKL
ncbi:MAG: DNA repair protein RadC [Ruminococcaceae bacterium]|nr:DNA repair protein RadC [Oscillospiraceae bacterium]